MGVEVDSCMAGVVLEAQALAAAWPLGQSVARWPEALCQDTDFSENYELKLEERSLETFPRIG